MTKVLRNCLLAIACTCLVVALLQEKKDITTSRKVDKVSQYMSEVKLTTFSKVGAINSYLEAKNWSFATNNQESKLNDAKLSFIYADDSWELYASTGIVYHNANESPKSIDLAEVKLIKDNGTTIINTPTANYNLEQQLITTDKEVTLTQPGLRVNAIGMRAFVDEKKLELMSCVETNYEHIN